MAWSAKLWFLAFFASLQLAFTGCGGAYPQVDGSADQAFMTRRKQVRTVDIMPMDVQLWTYRGNRVPAEQLGQTFLAHAGGTTVAELSRRGYQVVAQMDWDGNYDSYIGKPRVAMSPGDIDATAASLSSYGTAVERSGEQLLTPLLPARLGAATGSDATLYVGGWVYVGKPGDSTGKKVAKGVAIGLLAVALVAVVVLVVASKGGGGGGGPKGMGKLFGGAGKAAAGAGKAAAKAVVTVGRVAGRVTAGTLRGLARSGPKIVRGTARMADAFGRSDTHIDIHVGGNGNGNYSPPDYYQAPRTPKQGRSQMYLEMTLIDNHTGAALWHARQRLPADGSKPKHIRKALRHMLASLPSI
jgi:hypothetical protein